MAHRTNILRNPRLFWTHDPETAPLRNPGVLKISHERLRHFQSLSVTGPHQAVSQIRELCCQWLQPETHTKEQMMEQLVLEQFLKTLPEEVQAWVRSRRPRNGKEAGTLVANLIQACRKEDLTARDSVRADKRNIKGRLKEEPNTLDDLPTAGCGGPSGAPPAEVSTAAAQEVLTFQDVFVDFSLDELATLSSAQRSLYREVTLESYRSLVSLGYQVPRPDIISQLEEEESGLKEESSAPKTGPDGERGPVSKDPPPERSLPLAKPSSGDLEVGNVRRGRHPGASSPDGPLDSNQVKEEKPLSPVTASEPKNPARERSLRGHEPERSSLLPAPPEGPLGAAPRARAAPGLPTTPPPCKPVRETRISGCEFRQKTSGTQAAPREHEQTPTGEKPAEGQPRGEAFCLVPCLSRGQGAPPGDQPGGQRPRVHLRVRSEESYHECAQCGRAFVQEGHLLQHLQAHEAAKALPPALPRRRTLLIRYRQQHPEVGGGALQCCDCSKAFTQSSQLVSHYRTHAHERPFQCRLCGRCFSRPSQLTGHYQLHARETGGGRSRC